MTDAAKVRPATTTPARRPSTPGGSARARLHRLPDGAPPPALELSHPWSAEPVTPTSPTAALVQRWMAAPHVARHWQQDWPAVEWDAEIAAQLAGPHSRPWIVSHEGEAVAYVEIYRAAVDLVAECVPVDEHDLGVHVAIGDEARLGLGFGSGVLRAVAAALFAAEPACHRVLGDPEAGHVVARRAFAAAGYELVAEVDLPHKRAAIMACTRPSSDQSDIRPSGGERGERPS